MIFPFFNSGRFSLQFLNCIEHFWLVIIYKQNYH